MAKEEAEAAKADAESLVWSKVAVDGSVRGVEAGRGLFVGALVGAFWLSVIRALLGQGYPWDQPYLGLLPAGGLEDMDLNALAMLLFVALMSLGMLALLVALALAAITATGYHMCKRRTMRSEEGKEAVVGAVAALLRSDKYREEYGSIASTLADIAGTGAPEFIIPDLKHPDGAMRKRAVQCLEKMGWEPRNDVERAHCLLAKEEWDSLARLGEPAVELLTYSLQHCDAATRKKAAEALGKAGNERCIEPLRKASGDEDEDVRQAAQEALRTTESRTPVHETNDDAAQDAERAGAPPASETRADMLATPSHLGREPLAREVIIMEQTAVRRFLLSAHVNCRVIITNRRLVFWDKDDDEFSFQVSVGDLRDANFERAVKDLVIRLKDGSKYEIGLAGSQQWDQLAGQLRELAG